MIEIIEKYLDDVRPYLAKDSGGVDFVSYDEITGMLELRLTGMCRTCPLSSMTLRGAIERYIKSKLPQVNRIIPV